MNTILPKFVDFNSRTSFYKTNSTYMPNAKAQIIVFVCYLIILGFGLFVLVNLNHANNEMDKKTTTTKDSQQLRILQQSKDSATTKDSIVKDFFVNMLGLVICGLVICAIIGGPMLYAGKTNTENANTNKYYATGFHITNTNLMASTGLIKSNEDPSGNLDPHKNYHLAKYHVYVDLINAKPKGLYSEYITNQTPVDVPLIQTIHNGWDANGKYLDNDNKYNIVYLGYMRNGKFIPNYRNIKVVKIFMDYQDYIKRHHLESKFKHHFSFEVSHDYITKNHNPVLVVVGDNDFTLYYKNAKITKDSDIIASEGS